MRHGIAGIAVARFGRQDFAAIAQRVRFPRLLRIGHRKAAIAIEMRRCARQPRQPRHLRQRRGAAVRRIDCQRGTVGDLSGLHIGIGRDAPDGAPGGNLIERERGARARQPIRATARGDGNGVEPAADFRDPAGKHGIPTLAAVEFEHHVVARRRVQPHARRQHDIQPIDRRQPGAAQPQAGDLRAVGQVANLQPDQGGEHGQLPSARPSAVAAAGSATDASLPA